MATSLLAGLLARLPRRPLAGLLARLPRRPAAHEVVQPPRVVWPEAGLRLRLRDRRRTCPNCGSRKPKPHVLRVFAASPGHPERRRDVLLCPDCTARFMNTLATPDYADEDMLRRGRVAFYVQQGAGVSLITRPLAQLGRPPGSAYMEVGCGYGFGLDFALRAKGWHGRGIDPARLSALGRDALDVPIELRYLRDDDEAAGAMDVVLASEVIEHVPSPRAFARTLRAMLRPGGVLMLTTPNGLDLVPQTPQGSLVPLLSPGLHLVIQTPRSLRRLLLEAGFAHVQVTTDSHALIAIASDAPPALDPDPAAPRRAYRAHLEARAGSLDPATDVFLGYAGRALQEAVNDGDRTAADRAWALLVPACRARFGLDLDGLSDLPPAVATCSLEQLAQLMPVALGGLLYADSIRRLHAGAARPALQHRFLLAAAAADAMRRALGELAMEDGQTEDIGWTARAEALLCAAEGGDDSVVARAAALPPAPADGPARRAALIPRLLTAAVNTGHLELAAALAESEGWRDVSFEAPMTPGERDGLFALAMLDVQPGSPFLDRARARFAAVRAEADPGSGLVWAALRGEALAMYRSGQPKQAAALLLAAGGGATPDDMRAELDRAAAELAVLPTEPDLFTAAQGGTPWTAPQLGALPASPDRDDLFRRALVSLVNAGQVAAGRAVAEAGHLWTAPLDAADPAARDVLFCLAVLDVAMDATGRAVGEPLHARPRFAQVRVAAEPGGSLYWAAAQGELQALDLLGELGAAAALAAELAAHGPAGAPPDVLARAG